MPHDACNADFVIAFSSDNSRDRSTMTLFVLDYSGISDVVPTVEVALCGWIGIRPLIVYEVGMCEVNAAVNYSDDGCVASGRLLPRFQRSNVGSERSRILTSVVKRPLLGEPRIVRPKLVLTVKRRGDILQAWIYWIAPRL